MVASKFLNDDGEDDEVFNDEWAESSGMEKKDLNKLEIEFLSAIDWRIFVSTDEFQTMTERLESNIAIRQCSLRGGWTTYSDLLVLADPNRLKRIWDLISDCAIKVTAVTAASVGTCYVLSKTVVHQSLQTLYNYSAAISPFQPSPNDDGRTETVNLSCDVLREPTDVSFVHD